MTLRRRLVVRVPREAFDSSMCDYVVRSRKERNGEDLRGIRGNRKSGDGNKSGT